MLDENFKVFLIEVNTNPSLDLSNSHLAHLIPSMLENALRIVVDPLFPPPEGFSQNKQHSRELCPENKYDIIFDEIIDGPQLARLLKNQGNMIVEIDEDEQEGTDEDALLE